MMFNKFLMAATVRTHRLSLSKTSITRPLTSRALVEHRRQRSLFHVSSVFGCVCIQRYLEGNNFTLKCTPWLAPVNFHFVDCRPIVGGKRTMTQIMRNREDINDLSRLFQIYLPMQVIQIITYLLDQCHVLRVNCLLFLL